MFRHKVFIVGFAVFVSASSSAYAQSICNQADVVFVGRAEPKTTFRINGEAEIEKARQNYVRVEQEVASDLQSLDGQTQRERAIDLAKRLVKAKDEFNARQAMYPPPYDLTLTPVVVVQAFRGLSDQTVIVREHEQSPFDAGEEYLIVGSPIYDLMPPFPKLPEFGHIANYLEVHQATPVASAQRQLQFLASTMSGATIVGALRLYSHSEGPAAALGGVRVVVSSAGQAIEAVTREDGSFIASGLPAGDVDISPVLGADMTMITRASQTVRIRDGGCATVELRAGLNGRVRGKVVVGPGISGETVQLVLTVIGADRRTVHAHSPSIRTSARRDGTFEFSGVPSGTFLLGASIVKVVNGESRSVTTYFPGTGDLDAAMPIVVGKATLHEGFDFIVRTE